MKAYKSNLTGAVALLAGCALMGAAPGRADIQYSTEMLIPSQDKPFGKMTTYARAGAQRVETAFSIGGTEQRSVMLTLCDKKATYTLAPALKMYYVTPLVSTKAASDKAAGTPKAASGGQEKPGSRTGTMTMTLVSLRDLGEQTIGQYKTRCYEVTIRMQTSGCLGDSDNTTKQEICVAAAQGLSGGEGCQDMTATGETSDGA